MFNELYGESKESKATVKKVVEVKEEGKVEEEKKEGDQIDSQAEKPKKSVKFGKSKDQGLIKIYKQHRGKKTVCQIVGLGHYCKDLKTLASKFGKKFSCGSALATDDIHGECISI